MAFNQVTNLDFEDVKSSLKAFLRSSETFTDYNFEGSVLSQLLDVLAYNTYYSALNANLVANEVFFDSASIRENVVSLAKLVGYTPRSAKAAVAKINLDIIVNPKIGALTLNKGNAFIGNNGDGAFMFSVLNDITREAYIDLNGVRRVTFNELEIFQGSFLNLQYTVDTSTKQKFIVPSADADVDLLNVTVNEVDFTIPQRYNNVKNITELNSDDRVYFIQENKNEQFELIFGDGVFGRKMRNLDTITIEYLVTSKSEANECTNFTFTGQLEHGGQIFSQANPTITVVDPSTGGGNPENVTSIKYLAPRYYSAQNRAVTVRDYETLVTQISPNLESLSVYGGEEADPPQYGKVFIVAKPFGAETLTTTAKQNLKRDIKEYSILTVIPEVIDPSYLYLDIDSFVYYDNNKSRKNSQEIENAVKTTILQFGETNDLNRFNGKFKYSKLVGDIDNADNGITSNITRIRIRKNFQVIPNVFASYEVCYGNRISETSDIVSSGFKITGQNANYVFYLEKIENTNTVAIFRYNGSVKKYYSKNIGSIDYSKGEININAININSVIGDTDYITVSVIPKSNDIMALRDLYLSIDPSGVNVSVILDALTSSSRTSGVGQIPVSS
jgi:hypothetical protein